VNRRQFLAASVAVPIAASFSKPAHAWVVPALSIAASIAGTIAASNQKDVGAIYSYYNSEKLNLLIKQVSDVQLLIGDIISRLITLEDRIVSTVITQSVQQLHRDLLGSIDRFQSIKLISEFGARKSQMIAIRNDLVRSLYALRNSKLPSDSGAAIIVPSAVYTLNALNIEIYPEEREFRRRQIIEMYNWILSMTDERVPGTVAHDLNIAIADYEEYTKKVESHTMFSSLGTTEPTTGLCHGVNQYKVEPLRGKVLLRWEEFCETNKCRPTSRIILVANPQGGSRWYDKIKIIDQRPDIEARMKEAGLGVFKLDKSVATPLEMQLVQNNFRYDVDLKTTDSSSSPNYISDEECEKHGGIDIYDVFKDPDGEHRKELWKQHEKKKTYDAQLSETKLIVNDINERRYRIFYHFSCLQNCNATLNNLSKLLEI